MRLISSVVKSMLQKLADQLLAELAIGQYILAYYSPYAVTPKNNRQRKGDLRVNHNFTA